MNEAEHTVLLTCAPDVRAEAATLRSWVVRVERAAAQAGRRVTVLLGQSISRDREGPATAEVHSPHVDAVVHLRAARAAGPDGDTGLRAALAHPHLRLVLETGRGEDTAAQVVAAVLATAGLPEPVEVERKFLLAQAPPARALSAQVVAVVDIDQVYLPGADGAEVRVRRWSQGGDVHYIHTIKRDRADGTRTEIEHPITAEEYARLAAAPLAGTVPVRKRRHVSVQGAHRLELDELLEPVHAWLLEVEVESPSAAVTLPGWVGASREVTTDSAWRNRALARIGRSS